MLSKGNVVLCWEDLIEKHKKNLSKGTKTTGEGGDGQVHF